MSGFLRRFFAAADSAIATAALERFELPPSVRFTLLP